VRGIGLMIGLKLRMEPRDFVAHLREAHHGLLTVSGSDNIVRIVPPLVIDDSHIDEFMDKLSAAAASYQPARWRNDPAPARSVPTRGATPSRR
jgi:acetylornithine/N-succinyldiaminopimelate aminotransferase